MKVNVLMLTTYRWEDACTVPLACASVRECIRTGTPENGGRRFEDVASGRKTRRVGAPTPGAPRRPRPGSPRPTAPRPHAPDFDRADRIGAKVAELQRPQSIMGRVRGSFRAGAR
jgi:hypothetical protein